MYTTASIMIIDCASDLTYHALIGHLADTVEEDGARKALVVVAPGLSSLGVLACDWQCGCPSGSSACADARWPIASMWQRRHWPLLVRYRYIRTTNDSCELDHGQGTLRHRHPHMTSCTMRSMASRLLDLVNDGVGVGGAEVTAHGLTGCAFDSVQTS